MGPIHRIETSIGALALTAIRAAQRRALKVEVREHTDARGRVTPYLLAGTPRRGHLVWLHGFGDRFDTILQAAPRLMDDWQILAPSMPAFGEGWVDPAETHTFDAYADWMFAVLRDVAPPRFHLMGNSLGGATAVKVAARMPDAVESVVALNSAGVRLDGVHCAHVEMEGGDNLFEVQHREDYDRLQRRLFARPMKLPRPIETYLFDFQRRNADWYIRVGQDLSTSEVHAEGDGWISYLELGDVRAPLLALWGDQDTLFPVAHAEHLADTVERGEHERIEGVGHVPHLESPKRLADAFRRWSARLGRF